MVTFFYSMPKKFTLKLKTMHISRGRIIRMNWCSKDVVDEYMGVVRRLGYELRKF
jgi:hypothetical protein